MDLPEIEDTLAVTLTNNPECLFSDWFPIKPEPFKSKGEKYLAINRGPIVLISNVWRNP